MRWLGALALVAVLTACASGSGEGTPEATPESPSATQAATSPGDPEEAFLRLSASHLCAVQSSVFEDPADLAAAYEQAPAYPGLTAEEVAEFEQRLLEDPEFSERLLAALAETCG